MAYEDDYLDASLNGVSFHVQKAQTRGGRKSVVHEYWGRDDATAQDGGLMARRFQVNAFLIGDNHLSEVQDLIDVLESPGPYTLNHPIEGQFQVVLDGDYQRTSLDVSEQRVTRVQFTVVRVGTLDFPLIVDTAAELESVAEVAKLQVEEGFKSKFSLGKFINAITGFVSAGSIAMTVIKGKIASVLNPLETLATQIDDFGDQLQDLLDTPQKFASTFLQIGLAVFDLVNKRPGGDTIGEELREIRTATKALSDAVNEMFEIPDAEQDTDGTTPDRNTERANLNQVKLLFRSTALIGASKAWANLEPESANAATKAAEDLTEKYEEVLADPDLDPEAWKAMTDLLAATRDHLTNTAQSLPAVTTYAPGGSLPSIVLAYDLYGDAAFAEDIEIRNDIPNPAIVDLNAGVEVLANG